MGALLGVIPGIGLATRLVGFDPVLHSCEIRFPEFSGHWFRSVIHASGKQVVTFDGHVMPKTGKREYSLTIGNVSAMCKCEWRGNNLLLECVRIAIAREQENATA